MSLRSRLHRMLAPTLKRHPGVWQQVLDADQGVERLRTSLASLVPAVLRPDPRQMHVAITAHCNLRCIGCRYGREFMTGSQLSYETVRDLLDDARDAGLQHVRFYGGEPLLHPDLPRMIAHCRSAGLQPYVTTNAVLLREKVDALFDAGLREITIGFYGTGAAYDSYVQRKDRFARVEAGIAAARERYGSELDLRINWLLMRPSCNLTDLDLACRFAERYAMQIQVDLVHYSLPYFTEGPDRELQFTDADRASIERVTADLLRRKRERPSLFNQSSTGLNAIPDWLLKGPAMRVPCDSHQMLWVGADGTVQQCFVTFRLGNLHEQRLSTMLFTDAHRRAARDSFALNCPNCHCNFDRRTEKHAPSMALYGLRRADRGGHR